MLTDFTPSSSSALPVYRQLAEYCKLFLRLNRLDKNTRLPSIRRLSAALKLSRTTVENAYNLLLSEGYITSHPQKGYYPTLAAEETLPPETANLTPSQITTVPLYNFAGNSVDLETFDAALWRRCINNTLKNPQSIASYGSSQGEESLRRVLAKYSYEARGVITTPEQIVIGAGIQSLLAILVSILPMIEHRVALETPGFQQAETVFHDYNWQTEYFTLADLAKVTAPLLLVSPSNPQKDAIFSPKDRLALLAWARSTSGLILEDDYNGEFRYFSRPVGALQGLDGGTQVVYFGSFSRILMPALRIGYMVLPPTLLPFYRQKHQRYNQTASTIEQQALAEFIAGGHLRRHIRRLRKLYAAKNTLLRQELQTIFGRHIRILAYTSGIHIHLAVRTMATTEQLAAAALAAGVRILPVRAPRHGNYAEILLSFAGISKEDIRPALLLLKSAWFPHK